MSETRQNTKAIKSKTSQRPSKSGLDTPDTGVKTDWSQLLG